MKYGIERLGDFLESARLPISIKVASTVSTIPEDQIDDVLRGSDFMVVNHKIHHKQKYEKIMETLNNTCISHLNWACEKIPMELLCEDGKVIDFSLEGMTWQRG